MRALLWAVVLIGLVVGVPIPLFGPVVEILRSLIAIAAPLALVLMGGGALREAVVGGAFDAADG